MDQAQKDPGKLIKSNLSLSAREIIRILKINPWQNPPPYEKLIGNLDGRYSCRINIKHRLVNKVLEEERTVVILSMWSHTND